EAIQIGREILIFQFILGPSFLGVGTSEKKPLGLNLVELVYIRIKGIQVGIINDLIVVFDKVPAIESVGVFASFFNTLIHPKVRANLFMLIIHTSIDNRYCGSAK